MVKLFHLNFLLVAAIIIIEPQTHALPVDNAFDSTSNKTNVCRSSACKKLTQIILSNGDFSLDPCVDFHAFVCENSKVSLDESATLLVQSKISHLLKSKQPDVGPNLRKLRAFYTSCLRRGNRDHEPLIELLTKLGGFPLLAHMTGWTESDELDVTDLLIKFAKLGLDYNQLFEVLVNRDDEETNQFIMVLDAPRLKRPRNMEHYMQILMHLDPEGAWSSSEARNQIEKLVDFTSKLINDSEREKYKEFKFRELAKIAPSFDWIQFFELILDRPIRTSDRIGVLKYGYITRLNNLLKRSDPKTILNFMFFGLIEELGSKFATDLGRLVTSDPPKCTEHVKEELKYAFFGEYAKHYISPESRNSVRDLFNGIRNEFINIIDETDWIFEDSKSRAKDKLKQIELHIALPDKLLNESFVESIFDGAEFDPDNFLANIMTSRRIQLRLDSLLLAGEKWVHVMGAFADTTQVNAMYIPETNSILINAGQLDDLLIEPDRPSFFNFGIVGMVIGHEISHAFDPNCVFYNQNGDSECWWDPKTAKSYRERTRCLEQQYDSLDIPEAVSSEVKINGHKTLGENVADNAGHEIAYRAYMSWLNKTNQSDAKPQQLSQFTDRQLFWIGLANTYCGVVSQYQAELRAREDTHSPKKYRVNIPLMNSKNFSNDFGCDAKTPMNPKKKCKLW